MFGLFSRKDPGDEAIVVTSGGKLIIGRFGSHTPTTATLRAIPLCGLPPHVPTDHVELSIVGDKLRAKQLGEVPIACGRVGEFGMSEFQTLTQTWKPGDVLELLDGDSLHLIKPVNNMGANLTGVGSFDVRYSDSELVTTEAEPVVAEDAEMGGKQKRKQEGAAPAAEADGAGKRAKQDDSDEDSGRAGGGDSARLPRLKPRGARAARRHLFSRPQATPADSSTGGPPRTLSYIGPPTLLQGSARPG